VLRRHAPGAPDGTLQCRIRTQFPEQPEKLARVGRLEHQRIAPRHGIVFT
jgi:hypothetical protein